MAKRARGTRPGQRRSSQRPQQRPSAPARPAAGVRPSGALTAEEEQRAAELEARIVAEEREADEARRVRSGRERGAEPVRTRTAQSGTLALQAAQEYAYVARDVRRIATVAGSLLVVLALLYVAIEVLHLVHV